MHPGPARQGAPVARTTAITRGRVGGAPGHSPYWPSSYSSDSRHRPGSRCQARSCPAADWSSLPGYVVPTFCPGIMTHGRTRRQARAGDDGLNGGIDYNRPLRRVQLARAIGKNRCEYKNCASLARPRCARQLVWARTSELIMMR
jgi:hypothetical protein